MQSRLIQLLARVGLAFGAIATVTVLTVLLRHLSPETGNHLAPFLFLGAILACSWSGSYAAGVPSVFFVNFVSHSQGSRAVDSFRLALLLLLSVAVSWIEGHRRRVEEQLRLRVEESTAALQSAVEHLEREVQERKAAEEEIRRLNHRLELRVDERTRQLEVSNQELESFSYSVSHDLRAPLRSIDGFTRILLGTSAHKLDSEEMAMFTRVLNATGRMNVLIEDLLNLARVTRTEIHEERVDLSALATRIGAELAKPEPGPAPPLRFLIQPGISATCDSSLIEVVIHNLLDNGRKFTAHSPSPCVEFGAEMLDGQRVLYVRDNGAGFDPAYQSKLFSPFQRLHRQEEFPGTGIGLATVSRIVHRHGGWVKAQSTPGNGATFFFTLAGLHQPDDLNPPLPLPESSSASSARTTLM